MAESIADVADTWLPSGAVGILGTRLDDGLQVIREIERGVSSRVYLASDGRRLKALKLFRAENLARARRELDVGSRLDHPNLNPVERAVDLAGRPGVLMPLAPGRRLTVWSEGRQAHEVLATLVGVADALAYLHDLGIVHRDVKPENILVDGRDNALLLDFDLAARVGDRGEAAVAGTLAYLSPEQTHGGAPEFANDLYSFGALLYQAVTGQVPFTGSVDEVMSAHGSLVPLPPSGFEARLARFDPLVMSLLSKDPTARPPASVVAAALRRLGTEHRAGHV